MSTSRGQVRPEDAGPAPQAPGSRPTASGPLHAPLAPALRVASYNIHGAVGTDGRRDVERIAAVIGEIDPHIIALQEVESRRARGGIDQAERLASMLGMSCAEGPILEDGHGWYGNAILSKQPGSDVRHWRYPRHSGEPRAALGVRIADRSGQPWRVVATHLDLRFRARWHQVATLVDALADGGSEPLVLLADLNEWWPWAPSWRILSKLGEVPAGVRSFPSWCPILPLDRVVLRHCRMVKTPDTHVTALSRRASDHLPVVAEIRHGGEGSMTDRAADP